LHEQYLFIFQLHIVCFYATVVYHFAHSIAVHPERSQRRFSCPWPAPGEQVAPSAEPSTATGILAQASRKVIMKRAATLLALAVFLAFSAAQMAASTGTTQPVKAAPAGNLNTAPLKAAPSNTVLNFTVTDAHGVLLTCAKQQVDTDTFSGCTLAPGRTLDDLMTSIVQAIRAEQNKDKAEPK
jgi:hypothetical protein